MSAGLDIKVEYYEKKIILRLDGRLDASSSPILERTMEELIKKSHNIIILDFTSLDYLSSAGMRLLLSYTKKLHIAGGNLYCCCMSGEVMEIIKMAGFEKILRIFHSEKAALHAGE